MRRLGLLWHLRPSGRMLAGAAAALALGLFGVCVLLLLDSFGNARRAAEQGAANVAVAMAQNVARTIELYDLSLQGVVAALQLPGLAGLDRELRQMVLFDHSATAPQFGFINVVDETGDVTDDSRSKSPRSGNFATRDYFQAQKHDPQDQLFIGRPFLTAPDQPTSIPLSRRRAHPDGSFAGVVVGSLRLAYFRTVFAPLTLGQHGTIALVRTDGLVLLRLPFNADDIGRSLSQESPLSGGVAAAAERTEGVEPVDRVHRLYTLRRVGELPLMIAVGIAQDDIDAPWRETAIRIGAAAGGVSALSLALIAVPLTERRRLVSAEAATERASAETTRFLATMSHELRTPLASILGFAELLSSEGKLEPEQSGRLAALCSAGAHMRDVINRVLDITRPEAMANLPCPQESDLDALIAGCRGMVEPSAAAKGLRLVCHVAPDAPRQAAIDAGQVREVLLNLLVNAVKYTAQGEVELRMSGSPLGLRFEVADTGRGIPAEKRGRLFRAYDRLDERGSVEGVGLGLSIAQSLVRGMGGRIGHCDNPGGGSIFWVEIPTGGIGHLAAATVPPLSRGTPNRRILIVDDTALNRGVTGSFLRGAGHVVTEAPDGVEAVRQVSTGDFDLVLMDIRMPRMNGMEAAREIRALPGLRGKVPIVAVTADLTAPHLAGYRTAGIDRYLAKPFTSAELLAVVEEVTQGEEVGGLQARPSQSASVAAPEVLPLLEHAVLRQVASGMSEASLDAYLRTFAGRIRDLLALLRGLEADAGALDELVHEMRGSAGLLGFSRLAATLRQYAAEIALAGGHDAASDELIAVAEASLVVLRRRLEAGVAAVGS